MAIRTHRGGSVKGKLFNLVVSLAPVVAIGGSVPEGMGAPVLEYKFDDSGVTTASTGTASVPLKFYEGAWAEIDMHGAGGTGVTGASTDKALDQSNYTGMGNQAIQPTDTKVTTTRAVVPQIGAATSFTLAGWYKTSEPGEPLGRYAHLFDYRTGGSNTNGFELQANGGTLLLVVNGGSALSSAASYTDANKWVFFAVTYDGTATENNVTFYKGYRNEDEAGSNAVFSAVGTYTLNKGGVADPNAWLNVGNSDGRNRPFRGFLDDISVHAAQSGSGGALSSTDVSQLRAASVPEPSASLIGGGLGAALLWRRWR